MKKLLLIFFLVPALNAKTIASCEPFLSTLGFTPHLGQFSEKKYSGWYRQDKSGNHTFTPIDEEANSIELDGVSFPNISVTLNNGSFDILTEDTFLGSEEVSLLAKYGGEIQLLMLSDNSFTITHSHFQDFSTLSFWKNLDGEYRYSFYRLTGEMASGGPGYTIGYGNCNYIAIDDEDLLDLYSSKE